MNKRQQNNNKLPANSLPTSPKPVLKLVEEHEYSEHVEVLVPNDQTREQVLNVDIVPKTQLAHGTKADIAILLYMELLRQIRDIQYRLNYIFCPRILVYSRNWSYPFKTKQNGPSIIIFIAF